MGQRHYEQKDHLGNVVATISDRRIAVDQYNYTTGTTHVASTVINTVDPTRPAYVYVGTGGTKAFALGTDNMADSWMPEVESYSDYYPFGALMPGRNTNAGNYRYGYQNQECDPEISGEGNSYAFEYRFHDPRLGRFLSIDPLAAKYPYNSPYAFSENRVIDSWELEGLEKVKVNEGAVEGDPNVRSVSFENIGESPNLQVYYEGDDLNGPGRSDFKEGSYEQHLMHQTVLARKANGPRDEHGRYIYGEIPIYQAAVSNGQPAKYFLDDEHRNGVTFPTFFMLNIEFKPNDKTSVDANGVVNWASTKSSLNFLAQIMLDPSKVLQATGSRFTFNSAISTAPNSYKMSFLTIGFHSPHDFDGIPSPESDVYNLGLAQSRADNVSKYFVNKGVPALRLYTSNKGEDAVRRAQVIVHAEKVIQSLPGVRHYNP